MVGTLGQLESVTPELSLCPGSYHPLVVTLAPSDFVICPAPCPDTWTCDPTFREHLGGKTLSQLLLPGPDTSRPAERVHHTLVPPPPSVSWHLPWCPLCYPCGQSLFFVLSGLLLKMAVHLAIVQGPGLVQRMCLTHTLHLESVLPLLRGRDLWI